ncbi:MAG: hypothetical protein ACK53L_22640, partial [Pirellulaceae bacterium]
MLELRGSPSNFPEFQSSVSPTSRYSILNCSIFTAIFCPCSAIAVPHAPFLCPCPCLSVLCPRYNQYLDQILFYFILFYFIFAFHCNLFFFHANPPISSFSLS